MNTTHVPGPGRHTARRRRTSRTLLVVIGLVVALLASACDSSEQVPWPTYSVQLQQQIDSAADTGNCVALYGYLAAAKATSKVHEKATGVPNNALEAYIQQALQRAGCPARSS
jgi:hypothetical protein